MSDQDEQDFYQDDAEQDDAAIAVFFKRSMLVLVGLAVIGLIIFALTRETKTQVAGVESAPIAPTTSQSEQEPTAPTASFIDVTDQAGITFSHENGAYGEKLLPETMGGGVAFFDYDNDGLIDLLFINSSKWRWQDDNAMSRHRLYRNLGDMRFSDVSESANLITPSYGQGVAIGDYDGDGYEDVYITAVGHNHLFRNVNGKTFEQVDLGVQGEQDDWSSSAGFFDIDNDGDLDLFVVNYVEWSKEIDFEVDYRLTGIGRAYGPPTNYKGTHSRLFRNDGVYFTDISASAGIEVSNSATGLPVGKGLALRPVDLNKDGLLDIVVANDTVQNFTFINLGGGRFEEQGAVMGMAFDNSGNATGAMGIDTANYNNDDEVAVVIANFANEMTSFYVAQGSQVFTDESIGSGIGPDSRRALSFGLFFFDYDLDGRSDLLAANGHVEDDINVVQPSQEHAQSAQLFWNCSDNCRRIFKRVDKVESGDLSRPLVGRGAAAADLDNDGDADVILTQIGGAPMLLENRLIDANSESNSGQNTWLKIKLQQEGANRQAIGASVEVTATTHASRVSTQQQDMMPTKSYLSQFPAELLFGLGDSAVADVKVTWPDGQTQSFPQLNVNQTHTLQR